MVIEIVTVLSLLVNVLLVLYVRWLIVNTRSVEMDFVIIKEMIQSFSNHIQEVHELEMFYGDKTLQSLIEHGKAVIDEVSKIDLITNSEESFEETTPQED